MGRGTTKSTDDTKVRTISRIFVCFVWLGVRRLRFNRGWLASRGSLITDNYAGKFEVIWRLWRARLEFLVQFCQSRSLSLSPRPAPKATANVDAFPLAVLPQSCASQRHPRSERYGPRLPSALAYHRD